MLSFLKYAHHMVPLEEVHFGRGNFEDSGLKWKIPILTKVPIPKVPNRFFLILKGSLESVLETQGVKPGY